MRNRATCHPDKVNHTRGLCHSCYQKQRYREAHPDAVDLEARLEDLAWMADTGENTHGAARRLNMTRDALQKWLGNHDKALWSRLRAHDPTPLTQTRPNQHHDHEENEAA